MNKNDNILIIGAGLCGSLLALRLAQRGYQVEVFESRPDLRTTDISAGRSINLALSDRGFKALRLVGVEEKAREICIPMYGRLVHDIEGNEFASNYSGRAGEYINSISRGDLNGILLTEAEKHENVNIHFNKKCTSVDIENTIAHFKDYKSKEEFSIDAAIIFGTDGAGSVLRKSYYLEKKFLFSYSQNYLTHGYKELEIPADANGNHQISKDYLHIWPRGDYMLIALPNMNGSFTVTLFLGNDEGEYNFANLSSEEKIKSFFETQFPDVLKLIPNIADEFANNPTGALGTVKCSPWHYQNKTLLMGDAAHAVVPFYGQGMNAGFEDCTVLWSLMQKHNENWAIIFEEYQKNRKPDGDAVQDLSLHNYYVMRDYVADPAFLLQKKFERRIQELYPENYMPLYSQVSFSNIRYSDAWSKGMKQDGFIKKMIKKHGVSSEMESEKIDKIIHQVFKKNK